jgi:PRTRC genetic system ThiF family protein
MTAIHNVPPQFIHSIEPISVTVIGVGGTGSLMLARLAQINHSLKAMGKPGIQVLAIDSDKVSEANLGRGNFFPGDVGQYKAEVLISRINRIFGFAWTSQNERFDCRNLYGNIIITCVDKVSVRKQMYHTIDKRFSDRTVDRKTWINRGMPIYWLDLGNGRDFGQVILGSIANVEQPKGKGKEMFRGMLPTIMDLHPDLETYEDKDTPSCSVAEALFKQDLPVNGMMAMWAETLLWDMFTKYRITNHGIYISLKNYTTNPLPIKPIKWEIENGQDSTVSTTTPSTTGAISPTKKSSKPTQTGRRKSTKKRGRGLVEILMEDANTPTTNRGLGALLRDQEVNGDETMTAELSI